MPLELKPPRQGKTPFWYVRGTHLGVSVDRSTGLADRAKAAKILVKWREEIERGEFARPGAPTFLSAAVAYMKAGGERRFVEPLLDYFGDRPLVKIIQGAIDAAAAALYPTATDATRNRQVYSVVSAILKQAGVADPLKRPKGAAGQSKTAWLWPEQAFAIFAAADDADAEFGALLRLCCYTGLRLGEALSLRTGDVRLSEGFAYVGQTKNGQPRPVYLPPIVVAALASHPRGIDRLGERVFRFAKGGRLYFYLRAACVVASGLPRPVQLRWKRRGGAYSTVPETYSLDWVTFHTFRHTWATWMRRYGGLDTAGLVSTGVWKDRKSAARYEHVVVTEEATKANLLPTPPRDQSVENPWTARGAARKARSLAK